MAIITGPAEEGSRARALSPAQWALTLAAVLAVLLAIRLIALRYSRTELFFDEAQYWSWSLEPAFGYYSKPPLIAWLIRAATDSCGISEFCIRLPSPVLHTLTAVVVFEVGRRLYEAATGFFSGLVFATLPGVSVSAGIISTDVPLVLCWALALLGLILLMERRGWWPAVLIGAALGLGLNAKYTMILFVLSAAVYLAATPERRALVRDVRLWAALALGALLIAPNLVWNAANSFATFSHTADNAKWGGSLIHPSKAAEFFLAQFGVFGPILFASLLVIAVRAYRQGVPGPDRLLLAFTLPALVLITAQAFVSRAHANWAAVSYVAATVLVTATLLREASRTWLRASLALHAALLAVLVLATAHAGSFRLPVAGDPFARTLGWKALAERTEAALAARRAAGVAIAAVIADDRSVTAELLYYMRTEPTPVFAWREGSRPRDHYELSRPYRKGAPEPVLLVSLRRDASPITGRFELAQKLAEEQVPAGAGVPRAVAFYLLSGYRGP
jgi:4-amino-4-deoxy-L-arabinose transferase-like glycosyltransferase